MKYTKSAQFVLQWSACLMITALVDCSQLIWMIWCSTACVRCVRLFPLNRIWPQRFGTSSSRCTRLREPTYWSASYYYSLTTFLSAAPHRAFKLQPPNSVHLVRLMSLSVLYLFRLIRLTVLIKLKIKNDKNPIDLHWRNVQMSQVYSNSNCQNSNLNKLLDSVRLPFYVLFILLSVYLSMTSQV